MIMWIPGKASKIIEGCLTLISQLQTENSQLRGTLEATGRDLATVKSNFDWLRTRVNSLEMERALLFDKVAGIKIPVPEIARAPITPHPFNTDIFEDVGEKLAKDLGLPTYESRFETPRN